MHALAIQLPAASPASDSGECSRLGEPPEAGLPPPAPARLQPAFETGRVSLIDVVWGMLLLGILLMNIPFVGPA